MHWDLETKIRPVFMGRVVDVPGALAGRQPLHDVPNGAVTIAVRDFSLRRRGGLTGVRSVGIWLDPRFTSGDPLP